MRRIFLGKSYVRRVFWLVLVLAATAGCLFNITNRIIFLAGNPTSTTVSYVYVENITFPAVTVCNLNSLRRSYVEQQNLSDLFDTIFHLTAFYPSGVSCERELGETSVDLNSTLNRVLFDGRNLFSTFVVECTFLGRICTEDDFSLTLTRLGYCYTFNGGYSREFAAVEPRTSPGTGPRYGLRLLLNVSQGQYSFPLNLDAGVKIAVHPQSEPAEPDDIGVGIAPGQNAFIGVREARFSDTSSTRSCRDSGDVDSFNFLGEFYNYSAQACNIDCFYTDIADTCGCQDAGEYFTPTRPPYSELPACRARDICCEIGPYTVPSVCECPSACTRTTYSLTASYSAYPANLLIDRTFDSLGLSSSSSSAGENLTTREKWEILREDLVSANVYFESLNVEVLRTSDSYDGVALLSDIGGQLGLFVGASVISVMEFVVWVVDEVKDCTCGVSERKIRSALRTRSKTTGATSTAGSAGGGEEKAVEMANMVAQDDHRKEVDRGTV